MPSWTQHLSCILKGLQREIYLLMRYDKMATTLLSTITIALRLEMQTLLPFCCTENFIFLGKFLKKLENNVKNGNE